MDIRAYTDTDHDRVVRIAIEVFGPFFEDSLRSVVGQEIFENQHHDWRGDYHRDLATIHDPEKQKYAVVAEDHGDLAGFTAWTVDPERRSGEVQYVAVRTAHRRSHLATELCEHAFASMRAAGIEVVTIGTGGDWFHTPARQLYSSLGMTPFPNVIYYKAL